MLPDTSLFIYAYLRKEAPMSSQIECTQSSFADLLLYESDKDRRQLEALGRSAASALRAHEYLQRKPITGLRDMAKDLGLTYPTVAAALDRMRSLRIVKELTGFKRNRVFAYAPYVGLLSEGTEPIR